MLLTTSTSLLTRVPYYSGCPPSTLPNSTFPPGSLFFPSHKSLRHYLVQPNTSIPSAAQSVSTCQSSVTQSSLPTYHRSLFYDELVLLDNLFILKECAYILLSPHLSWLCPQNERNNAAVLNSMSFEIRSLLISSVSLNKTLNLSKAPVLDNNTNFIRLLIKLKE